MSATARYDLLADLLEYPGPDYPAAVQRAAEYYRAEVPAAARELDAFARALPPGATLTDGPLAEMQELFTRSFDVQAVTTLSVGYVAFGDDYKRGELLVNLSREEREAGVEPRSELPDHLPVILRLLGRWREQEVVTEFVHEILQPALAKMIDEFGSRRVAERNRLYEKHFKTLIESSPQRSTIFRHPLAALAAVLDQDFGAAAPSATVRSDFLRSVGRELELEGDEGRVAKSRSIL